MNSFWRWVQAYGDNLHRWRGEGPGMKRGVIWQEAGAFHTAPPNDGRFATLMEAKDAVERWWTR